MLAVAGMQGAKVIVVSAMSSLGSTSATAMIEQTWSAPELRTRELTQVVTRFSGNGLAITRSVEEKLAQALVRRGMAAMPAYAVLTGKEQRDHITSADALRRAGCDGIITMRVLGRAEKLAWSEPIARIEADAYSLRARRIVWAARAKSSDPRNLQQLIDDVTDVVGAALVNQDVIRPLRSRGFRGKH